MSSANSIELSLLLDACSKGVEKAQMELYQRYYKAMYNSSLRIVKDDALAEDVMQEAFLAAFDKLYQYKAEVSFGAWLKRIVINKSIAEYRKKNKENWMSLDESKIEIQQSANPTDESTDKMEWIHQKIKSLNERYALVLTLHLIEGYDYKEIAQILELTDGTSRTLISRAKERLRTELINDPQWKKIS